MRLDMHNQGSVPTSGSFARQSAAGDTQQWEYRTRVLPAKKMDNPHYPDPLNELGDDGWEMVNALPGNTVVADVIYVFKRPKRR